MRLTRHLIAFLFLLTTSVSMVADIASADCREPASHAVASGEKTDVSASDADAGSADHSHVDETGDVDFSALCHAGMAACSGCFFPIQELIEPVLSSSIQFRFVHYDGYSVKLAEDLRPPRILG